MSGGINVRDSVLIVEGGLSDWRTFDAAKDRAFYDEMKALHGKAFTDSAVDLPGSEMPITANAPGGPVAKLTTPRTTRQFTHRPMAGENDEDGFRITKVIGGLPDWRHDKERRAIARAEHAAQLEAAKNIAPTLAQPEAAPTDYQSAKDGEPSPAQTLADTLTPAQTLTIKQLMDPQHDFSKAVAASKTE
jgi:hypothetical protein